MKIPSVSNLVLRLASLLARPFVGCQFSGCLFSGCLLVGFLFVGCSDKPDYPATDAAISDASTDAADASGDAANDIAADATSDDTDAEPDTTADAGPCQDTCTGDTPHCQASIGTCVACLDDAHCIAGVCTADRTCVECLQTQDCAAKVSENACNTDTNECVACVSDDDCPDGGCADNSCVECTTDDHCTDPAASACDTATNACTACADSDDCSHLPDTALCDTSGDDPLCVECTVTDESACGLNSCDPATNSCTQTPTGQTDTCMPCKADSECITDHRCVPMEFDGTQLADGFCLKIAATGCERPYTGLIQRESTSGEPSETYCGVDESVTSCDAVLDLFGDQACSTDADCGFSQHSDGRCETVNFVANRCTYSCDLANQCPASTTCGGSTNGSDYCGG